MEGVAFDGTKPCVSGPVQECKRRAKRGRPALAEDLPGRWHAGGMNPEHLLAQGGPVVLAAIVFAESGILAGFFLPGDCGGSGRLRHRPPARPALFRRADSRFFRRQHLSKANAFFERHGSRTIVRARFVPIVRTFAPVVAGAGTMAYRSFVVFNLVGAFAWTVGVTTAGHFLGQIDVVRTHIELAILAIVALSIVPVAIETTRHRRVARALR